ncbi:hypothetical protein NMG60_11016692 [Bertholletia excelsa]
MDGSRARAEAERLLGIAEKLLQSKDFHSSRDFAILAHEAEPLLETPYQILAVADVLRAADKRVNHHHHDWYAILQIERRSDDLDLIKRQYRRLALLLHPDKNNFPFADSAFRLVAEAWAVLSSPAKKSAFDAELGFFSKVDLVPPSRNQQSPNQHHQFRRDREDLLQTAPPPTPPSQAQPQPQRVPQQKAPARRGSSEAGKKRGSVGGDSRPSNFWTACPYCFHLYEYPKAYTDCCIKCQNCEKSFHAAAIPSLPPLVPGKDAYYCCWGFFPLGFVTANVDGGKEGANVDGGKEGGVPEATAASAPPKRKRGRPRKNVQA